jgi:hypothetical protein
MERVYAQDLRLMHQHKDGSWAELQEQPAHHDAAHHDPERGWSIGRLFVCRSCPEQVAVPAGHDGTVGEPH